MNLPRISRPPTASELRDGVLAQMNGESRDLSETDLRRRKRILQLLQGEREQDS